MELDYYWRQQGDKPLFPDIEWSKPEQRAHAGRLGIIGGNKLGFAGVADAYDVATKTGVGELKVLLPDALRHTIPTSIHSTIFAASNPSGGLARDAYPDLHALGEWATGILMIGDAGKNSETAILYEDFVRDYHGPLVLARDAVDLMKYAAVDSLLERPNTVLVLSFAQLQKLSREIYFTRILTFSMQLTTLAETLHKFTLSYPITLVVFHKDHIFIAHEGQVITQNWSNPMAIWKGDVATRAAVYLLWHKNKPLEAIATSLHAK